MSCLLRHLRALCCALLGLAAALGSGACAGTPLPEPPDSLPRPESADFNLPTQGVVSVGAPELPVASFSMAARLLQPGRTVLIINLDAPEVPVERLTALDAPDGGNPIVTLRASVGDRLRVLVTTDRAHSPPFDLTVLTPELDTTLLPVAPLVSDARLDCLQVRPNETLALSGTRGELTLINQCGVTIELTRAELRSGAEGLRLTPPPARLEAGARITLVLEDTQGPGRSERLDVLLLDVAASGGQSERYAIDVFSDLR